MTADIAVMVVHGIASREHDRPASSDQRTFSADLYAKLRRRLGRKAMARVAWREVFWADVLATRQRDYLGKIQEKTRWDKIRRFMVTGIADAAAVQPRKDDADNAYRLVQSRVHETLAELDGDGGGKTPVIVLAHSFGGWIVSNYVWDVHQGRIDCPSAFQRLETLDRFITFGSNIPLFTFAYAPEDIQPIRCPHPSPPKDKPWWLNYYDKDDVLGFPIGPIGPAYEQMVAKGELADISINTGGFFSSWNPRSHEQYWTDRDFYDPVADILKAAMR